MAPPIPAEFVITIVVVFVTDAAFTVFEMRIGELTLIDVYKFPTRCRAGPPTMGFVPMPTLDRMTTVIVFDLSDATSDVDVASSAALIVEVVFISPSTYKVVPDGVAVPICTNPEAFEIELVLTVPVFARVAETAFETDMEFRVYIFPRITRVGPPTTGAVPIPTFADTTRVVAFAVDVLIVPSAKMRGAPKLCVAKTFPGAENVDPPAGPFSPQFVMKFTLRAEPTLIV